jgi:hypothetical protein
MIVDPHPVIYATLHMHICLRIQSGSTRRGEGGGAQLAARSRSGAGDGAPAASFSPVSRRLSSPSPLRVSWILPPRAAPAASAVIFVSNPVPLLSCAGGFAAAPPTRGCPGAFPHRRQAITFAVHKASHFMHQPTCHSSSIDGVCLTICLSA